MFLSNDYIPMRPIKQEFQAEINIRPSQFLCEFCDFEFNLKSLLIQHVHTVHADQMLSIKIEPMTTVVQPESTQQSGNTKRFKCEICGKFLSRQYGLDKHKRTHSAEKPYKCCQCSEGFSAKHYLL
eukprot:880279_1